MLPTLFKLGPVAVHSYGVMLMLGFIAGMLAARRQADRLGLPRELALDLGLWVLVGSVAGARLLFAALNWWSFRGDPMEVLYLWRVPGLSFHGGLLGGLLAGLLLARTRQVSFWALADLAAPGIALGYGITRIGCFLNGCCYGSPTSLPWGVRFPVYPDSPLLTDPSHPVQLYSALGSFAIFAALLWARPRLAARGQLFLLWAVLYAALRAGMEVLRKGYTAEPLWHGAPITQGQLASAVMLALGLIGFIRRGRRSGEGDAV